MVTPLHHLRNLKPYYHLAAVIFFLVLTFAMTWPIAVHLNTHVTPGQQPVMTVPYLNLWTLAWNHQWLKGKTDNYWDANLFHPHQKTLAYSEPQFGMGLLTIPLSLLGANTVLTYNLLLLGFVWGAAMAVYLLCWHLFKEPQEEADHTEKRLSSRWIAAVTAGILYGFHFYIFNEMGVLQLTATLFPPLTFLGMHRFFNTRKWTDALLCCFGYLGCWYTCAYYGLFLSVFVGCFVIRFGYRVVLEKAWKTLTRGALTATLAILCLLPLIIGMQSAKTSMGFSRSKSVVQILSATFSDYLKPPQHSWLYGKILGIASPEHTIFFGAMLTVLAGIGSIAILQSKSIKNTGAIAIETMQFSQHSGKFYFAMACLAFWLSFGMAVTPAHAAGLGGYRVIAWLSPYNLLYQIVPGFSSIRSPYRFSIFCILFFTILAGWGVLQISQRLPSRWRAILIPILVVIVLLEHWVLPLKIVKVSGSLEELPRIYQHVKKLPAKTTLLELPMARGNSEHYLETQARALYNSTFHWLKITNGYSGFIPRANVELQQLIGESSPETILAALRTFGIQYVLVHQSELNETEAEKITALEENGFITVASEDTNKLYKVIYILAESEENNLTEPQQVGILTEGRSPKNVRATLYESRISPDHVTLCLYYHVDDNISELTTPWGRNVKSYVTWSSTSDETDIVHISTGIQRDSQLLTKKFNVIVFDISAPPPGEYLVHIQQQVSHNKRTFEGFTDNKQGFVGTTLFITRGICHIYESRFVTFQSIAGSL